MHPYPILIAVADEHAARFFIRAEPHGPLCEKLDYAETADLKKRGDPQPCDIVRSGGRLRVKPRADRRREARDVFLRHVAERVDQAMTVEGAESLVIVAPPFVLAGIRDHVALKTRKKLVRESCADLVRQTDGEIDAEMRRVNM